MSEFILQNIMYVLIPIIGGIVLSYTVEVVDDITPKCIRGRYILFVFSLILIFIETKAFEQYYSNIYGFIFGYFSNIIVALFFYKKYGREFVDNIGLFIFKYIKKFLNKKIKNLDNNNF